MTKNFSHLPIKLVEKYLPDYEMLKAKVQWILSQISIYNSI